MTVAMRNFFSGLRDYFRAGRLILKLRLWPWLVVPGLIGLLYFPGLLWLAFAYMGGFAAQLRADWLPEWMDYALVAWLVTVALWSGGAYLGFNLYRNVVMVIYGPVLGIVSEQTEVGISGRPVAAAEKGGIWRGMKRGILMSVTSLVVALLVLLCCWALVFVPVIGGLLLALALPLSQMFLAGQGFFDPTLERKGFGIRASFGFCWRHRMWTLGCGAGFTLLALLPAVGWFLAPGFGIVAGTRSVLTLLEDEGTGR